MKKIWQIKEYIDDKMYRLDEQILKCDIEHVRELNILIGKKFAYSEMQKILEKEVNLENSTV